VGRLDGRVAAVTGAGNGIGRQHALLLAAEGAKVVVNDLGWHPDGSGEPDKSAADRVVAEIVERGGQAVANYDNVATWDGGANVVETALDAFGELHVLVNNAGIIRNCDIVDLTEEVWDAIVDVDLKSVVATTRRAAVHWRERADAGRPVKASVVHTASSTALSLEGGPIGVTGHPTDNAERSARRMNQSNYIAAKAGVVAFGLLCSVELAPYGVRSNVLCPRGMTRMATVYSADGPGSYVEPELSDPGHPANNSPLVAYLATEGCPVNGQVMLVIAGSIIAFQKWTPVASIEKEGRWEIDEIAAELPRALHLGGG
jgi:NAD(P)-dependent dehydrogenase (short-subunit alcohol dehydrogenase family)